MSGSLLSQARSWAWLHRCWAARRSPSTGGTPDLGRGSGDVCRQAARTRDDPSNDLTRVTTRRRPLVCLGVGLQHAAEKRARQTVLQREYDNISALARRRRRIRGSADRPAANRRTAPSETCSQHLARPLDHASARGRSAPRRSAGRTPLGEMHETGALQPDPDGSSLLRTGLPTPRSRTRPSQD